MKFKKAIENVSTRTILKRFCSAYVVDHRNLQEEEILPALSKTAPQYFFIENVSKALDSYFSHLDRRYRLLSWIILKEVLLNQDSFTMQSADLYKAVTKFQSSVIDDSKEPEKEFKGSLGRDRGLFKFIVETAWESDDEISPDEKHLIDKVRKKLKISERDHFVLEARLNKFPQIGNKVYLRDDISEITRSLQSNGLLIEVRDDDDEDYLVIPEEIASAIRGYYNIEVRRYGYKELLNYKTVRKKEYLKEVLSENGYEVDKYATLTEMQNIVIDSIKVKNLLGGLTPRGGLSVTEISDWCKDLDLPVSGTKTDLIDRIVERYDGLNKHVATQCDEREIWYNHFDDLAYRKIGYFRGQNLISKDIEIEKNFEKATNYLFEVILGHKPLTSIGSKHEDGRLSLGEGVLLWDNKSSENPVSLQSHIRQFDGYIHNCDKKVEGFLVIAPEFTDDSASVAMKYSVETGIKIALVKSKDLKELAEKFRLTDEDSFPLRYLTQSVVFNLDILGI